MTRVCSVLAAASVAASAALAQDLEPAAAHRARLDALSPVFTAPAGPPREDLKVFKSEQRFRVGKPEWVMPVGGGNLSAMVSFGENTLHLHLSKTDYLARQIGGGVELISPGHVEIRFANLTLAEITGFEQKLDLAEGCVRVRVTTATGTIEATVAGDMERQTLWAEIADGRTNRGPVTVRYDNWRAQPEAKLPEPPRLTVEDGLATVREAVTGLALRPPARPDSPRWLPEKLSRYHALAMGIRETPPPVADGTDALVWQVDRPAFRLAIAGESSPSGDPMAAAKAALAATLDAPLAEAHRRWWAAFWERGWVDVTGTEQADRLTQLWHVTLYSYACVGNGPFVPKFNGGPGLVTGDLRGWGRSYWWQNTREIIWPMGAANRLEYNDRALRFYHTLLPSLIGVAPDACTTAQQQELLLASRGVMLPETTGLLGFGAVSGLTEVPDLPRVRLADFPLDPPAALKVREAAQQGYVNHILSSQVELTQQMLDHVAYTGDEAFLQQLVRPWLEQSALYLLNLLTLEADGFYHARCVNANETFWKVDDATQQLAATRWAFGKVIALADRLQLDSDLVAACRERLAKLAPFPLAESWKLLPATEPRQPPPVEVAPGDRIILPAAIDSRSVRWNSENPDQYPVFPFGLFGIASPAAERELAIRTFQQRKFGNGNGSAGWDQSAIQAAWLGLPEAPEILWHHARNSAVWPYGGFNSPAGPMYEGARVVDCPYFDAAGVSMTGLQECLLQSHALEPDGTALGIGPIRLLPVAMPAWSGSFRLRARGGFLVTARFAAGKLLAAELISERGNLLAVELPEGTYEVAAGEAAASRHTGRFELPTSANLHVTIRHLNP